MPIDSVALFRIALGAILFWEVGRFFHHGWIKSVYLDPPFHFTYLGFSWVRPLPGWGLYAFFFGLGLTSACVALGTFYRVAIVLTWAGFTYLFLLEKAVYLNHAYLICLLCFLMIFIPANGKWSFDARRKPKLRRDVLPRWCLWILRFQLALPYVYGGIAKLGPDWLAGQPMHLWLMRAPTLSRLVPVVAEPWFAMLVSYGGLLLDLLIVPALLWKRTRAWAFGFAVAFHLTNAFLFHIGVFPWLMICATTIFFEPDWPQKMLRRLRPLPVRPSATASYSTHQRLTVTLLGFWVLIHLLVPFRHWLYPGDVNWTEEGYRFSWRMMLNDKNSMIQLAYVHPESGWAGRIDPRIHLTLHQINRLSKEPDLLEEYVLFLRRELEREGLTGVEIRALVYCSLNGRRPQWLTDPTADLAAEPRSLRANSWLVPLTEPLPEAPWLLPPIEWVEHLDVEDSVQRLMTPRSPGP